MNFKSFHLLAIGLLLALAAFRPWRSINDAAGLRNETDSVDVSGQSYDSVLVTQPIQVVLPPSTVDSLSAQLAQQAAEKDALLNKVNKKKRELAALKKEDAAVESALVSEQEIHDLLAKQQRKHSDNEESDLEKNLNHKIPK